MKQARLTVGDRIKKRRNELGWTQDLLAEKAGISKSFLSDLENGKRSVSADNLLDIARALSLSLDYLMTGEASRDRADRGSDPGVAGTVRRRRTVSRSGRRLMLLDMQKQIVAHRSAKKKDGLESVDWRKFYEGVKEFLE